MVARVVVFPEPVGPVTRKRPRGRRISSLQTSGRPICSKVRSLLGMRRKQMARSPRCRKTLSRRRSICIVDMGYFLRGRFRESSLGGGGLGVDLGGGGDFGGGGDAAENLELPVAHQRAHAVGERGPPQLGDGGELEGQLADLG